MTRTIAIISLIIMLVSKLFSQEASVASSASKVDLAGSLKTKVSYKLLDSTSLSFNQKVDAEIKFFEKFSTVAAVSFDFDIETVDKPILETGLQYANQYSSFFDVFHMTKLNAETPLYGSKLDSGLITKLNLNNILNKSLGSFVVNVVDVNTLYITENKYDNNDPENAHMLYSHYDRLRLLVKVFGKVLLGSQSEYFLNMKNVLAENDEGSNVLNYFYTGLYTKVNFTDFLNLEFNAKTGGNLSNIELLDPSNIKLSASLTFKI
ncbi:MAG: hypothetical protein ABIA04_00880 [Pseudomonadota bacterium]